jgi:central kinetochore subunit Mis15/CHL4
MRNVFPWKTLTKHVYIQSHPDFSLLIIRLVLTDGSFQKDDLLSSRRTFFLGIPSSSPYIFHTPATDQLQEIIRQSLSQVFSTPRHPVVVTRTKPSITAKTLATMMTLCGANRETAALGAWRIYAKGWADGSPLAAETIVDEEDLSTGREALARARFGLKPRKRNVLAVEEDEVDDIVTPALERVEWRIIHGYPDDSQAPFAPSMNMRLEGANVFHGVYEGVLEGWIDGERVPGWLIGEEGRSEGKVRDGRIVDI